MKKGKPTLTPFNTSASANYPAGVLVDWRDGFYIATNYSETTCTLKLPAGVRTILGSSALEPGGVTVWAEDTLARK